MDDDMITGMTTSECLGLLEAEHMGRLACTHDQQPYIVPISYAARPDIIYCLATPGRKIQWMRLNPLVCLQIDRIVSRFDWQSVVVFGRYEEIPDDKAHAPEREIAWEALQTGPNWWEPAYSETIIEGVRRIMNPVYFRVRCDEICGRRMRSG
jgi:uncharacterized protein